MSLSNYIGVEAKKRPIDDAYSIYFSSRTVLHSGQKSQKISHLTFLYLILIFKWNYIIWNVKNGGNDQIIANFVHCVTGWRIALRLNDNHWLTIDSTWFFVQIEKFQMNNWTRSVIKCTSFSLNKISQKEQEKGENPG